MQLPQVNLEEHTAASQRLLMILLLLFFHIGGGKKKNDVCGKTTVRLLGMPSPQCCSMIINAFGQIKRSREALNQPIDCNVAIFILLQHVRSELSA